MSLPNKIEANALLEKHVQDPYQRYHALMVATAMDGYANVFQGDPLLWHLAGLLRVRLVLHNQMHLHGLVLTHHS